MLPARVGADPAFRLQDIAGSKITKTGELVLTASEYRTQAENREAARARLTALVNRFRLR